MDPLWTWWNNMWTWQFGFMDLVKSDGSEVTICLASITPRCFDDDIHMVQFLLPLLRITFGHRRGSQDLILCICVRDLWVSHVFVSQNEQCVWIEHKQHTMATARHKFWRRLVCRASYLSRWFSSNHSKVTTSDITEEVSHPFDPNPQ